MRQIGILPSGCQVHNPGAVININEHRIIYASTLSVVVINAKTYVIEKILASDHVHGSTGKQKAESEKQGLITSFSVSPHDANMIVTCGEKGVVCCWDIKAQRIVRRITVPNCGKMLVSWNPSDEDDVALVSSAYNSLKFMSWKVSGTTVSELYQVKATDNGNSNKVSISVVRWNSNVKGQCAIGCRNGTVIVFDTNKKRPPVPLTSSEGGKDIVVDLQWDRLSTIYILIAYEFKMSLWDVETGSEIHVFEKQSLPITAIAWLDWTAGNFVTSNKRNSSLKVWNASQKNAISTITMGSAGDCGVTSVILSPGKRKLLASCVDGTLFVFNMQDNQREWRLQASHTDTIFDCKFSHADRDVFATGSYDGTVKLWSVHGLALQQTLYGCEEIVYCVDFSPDGSVVVCSNVLGVLTMWETLSGSGRVLARYIHHSEASYCVSWNKVSGTEDLVASSSSDGTFVVISVDAAALRSSGGPLGSRKKGQLQKTNATPSNIRFSYRHPASVFGCEWSPTHGYIVATGCADGVVRVFDTRKDNVLFAECIGHSARVFSIKWSPLLKGFLATGSDDKTVMVWEVPLDFNSDMFDGGNSKMDGRDSAKSGLDDDYQNRTHVVLLASSPAMSRRTQQLKPLKVMEGHSSFVRGLCWSHELSSLLLSGSWDATIRLYDIDTGVCMLVVDTVHLADVYSIVSHPGRPFTFLSASRDTTVRVWELTLSLMKRISAVWQGSLDFASEDDGEDGEEHGKQMTINETITSMSQKRSGNLNSRTSSSTVDMKHYFHFSRQLKGVYSQQLQKECDECYGASASESRSADGKESEHGDSKQSERSRSKGGSELRQFQGSKLAMARMYYKLYAYFNGASGSMEVWENALQLLSSAQSSSSSHRDASNCAKSSSVSTSSSSSVSSLTSINKFLLRDPATRAVVSEHQVLVEAKTTESKLLASAAASRRGAHEMSAKVEGQLRQAALLCAKSGQMAKYCGIMVELGDWNAALALAPAVSMEYWQELVAQNSQRLISQSSEQCVPYLLAAGADADAVEFYLQRRSPGDAMLVAKYSETRTDRVPSLEVTFDHLAAYSADGDKSRRVSSQSSSASSYATTTSGADSKESGRSRSTVPSSSSSFSQSRERTEAEMLQTRSILRAVAKSSAEVHLQRSQPMLAAAHFMSVGDVQSAVSLLMNNREPDMAYALARCFDLDTGAILLALVDRCADLNSVDLALRIISTLPRDAEEDAGLFLSRHFNAKDAKPFETKWLRNRSPAQWAERASEEEQIGSDADAVASYVISRNYEKAIAIGLKALDRYVTDPFGMSATSKKVLRALKHVRAQELPEHLRLRLLCYVMWFAAHEALELGLQDTACCMLHLLLGQAKGQFPLTVDEVRAQLLLVLLFCGRLDAWHLLASPGDGDGSVLESDLVRDKPAEVRQTLQSLRELLKPHAAQVKTGGQWSGGSSSGLDSCRHSRLGNGPTAGVPSLQARDAPWGTDTSAVFAAAKRLADLLDLPPVARALLTREDKDKGKDKGKDKNTDRDSGGRRLRPSAVDRCVYGPAVEQGSTLSIGNGEHAYVSCISGRAIETRAVEVTHGSGAYASVNELLDWGKVNPFTPLLDGRVLYFD